MSPITITALVIFAITYILMMAFQKIRPYVAVASAIIFIALGIVAAVNPGRKPHTNRCECKHYRHRYSSKRRLRSQEYYLHEIRHTVHPCSSNHRIPSSLDNLGIKRFILKPSNARLFVFLTYYLPYRIDFQKACQYNKIRAFNSKTKEAKKY